MQSIFLQLVASESVHRIFAALLLSGHTVHHPVGASCSCSSVITGCPRPAARDQRARSGSGIACGGPVSGCAMPGLLLLMLLMLLLMLLQVEVHVVVLVRESGEPSLSSVRGDAPIADGPGAVRSRLLRPLQPGVLPENGAERAASRRLHHLGVDAVRERVLEGGASSLRAPSPREREIPLHRLPLDILTARKLSPDVRDTLNLARRELL